MAAPVAEAAGALEAATLVATAAWVDTAALVAAAVEAIGAGDEEPSSEIDFCKAIQVVEEAGQPCPVPFKFCNVTRHASMRASWEAVELSWGNVTATLGLWTTKPAATFAFRDYSSCQTRAVRNLGK